MTSVTRTIFRNANLLDGEHPARPGVTVTVESERNLRVDISVLRDLEQIRAVAKGAKLVVDRR